eukprot:629446-Prorocentrum_minimum.AAC.1
MTGEKGFFGGVSDKFHTFVAVHARKYIKMVGLTSGVDPIGDSRSVRFRVCTPSSPYPSRMHKNVVGLTSGVDPMCAPAHFFFHLR